MEASAEEEEKEIAEKVFVDTMIEHGMYEYNSKEMTYEEEQSFKIEVMNGLVSNGVVDEEIMSNSDTLEEAFDSLKEAVDNSSPDIVEDTLAKQIYMEAVL